MKKKDRQILMLAAAAAVGWFIWKKKKEGEAVTGVPGIGATLPNNSLVPAAYRGQCSPWWMDLGLWGTAGVAAGYMIAKKKLF